jgi:hypothetical protein
MQIKTILRFLLIHVRVAVIKIEKNNNLKKNVEEMNPHTMLVGM